VTPLLGDGQKRRAEITFLRVESHSKTNQGGEMSDDLTNRGPKDRARVNVNEGHEVKYWCAKFGCTETQLRAAVKAVGVMAVDVEKHLRK